MENLFSWEVTSFVVAVAVGSAFAVLAMNDFKLAKIFFFIAALDAASGIAWWGATTNVNSGTKTIVVFVATGLIGLAALQAFTYVHRKEEKTAPAKEEPRSYLAVDLVVDKVEDGHAEGHFLLKNEGPIEITVSDFIDKTSERTASEGSMEPLRNIIPGGSLIRPTGFSVPKDGVGIIASRATYTSGKGQPFTVTYQFNIRDLDLIAGRVVEPISRDESAGTAEPMSQIMMDGFRKPVGSLTFWFSEKLQDGSPNPLIVSAGDDRRIAFDPKTRLVHLRIRSNGKTSEIARPLLDGKQGLHFVAATWDATGDVHLYVDGSQ